MAAQDLETIVRHLDLLAKRIADQEVQLERLETRVAVLHDDTRRALEKLTRLRLFLENKLG